MIPFIDLQAQRRRLGQPLEDAILKVVRSGAYIMGPEIAAFEAELAALARRPSRSPAARAPRPWCCR